MRSPFLQCCCFWWAFAATGFGRKDEWLDVPCDESYQPENCDLDRLKVVTVDDYDRCAPAELPLDARNYFLAASGRRVTYRENKEAFDRIKILPRMLRDVSSSSLETSVLGNEVDFPIGISPVALHKLAHPEGELATLRALASFRTVMILSSYASTLIEEVGKAGQGSPLILWMQIYVLTNRSETLDMVRRAERSGFQGIVVTADSNVEATVSCDGRDQLLQTGEVSVVNLNPRTVVLDPAFTFRDITWLKRSTHLPIIVKGLLSGEDAVRAAAAGADAILVSNHGGRQLDGVPATIDALPGIVNALKRFYPRKDVYMDGGVRSGSDVYKALARGAKMVFVGRPSVWGLAMEGAEGVRKVMNILIKEFKETMLLSGASKVNEIRQVSIFPRMPVFGRNAGDFSYAP